MKITFEGDISQIREAMNEFLGGHSTKIELMQTETIQLPPSYAVDGTDKMNSRGESLHSIFKPWGSYDLQFIRDNYKTTTYTKLADRLGRTRGAVSVKISELITAGQIERKRAKRWISPLVFKPNTTIRVQSDGVKVE